MTITGIAGDIGSGKSFKQLQYALEQANTKRKRLVTNFGLNYQELKKYCAMKKYGWVAYLIDSGQIAVVDSAENIAQFLKFSNSICCLDEAGIFLNSRSFADTPKSLLMDLAQSRKDGVDLIWCSQFDEQVDRQFRLLTQYWIHCEGTTSYDSKMKRPKLVWKTYYHFKGAEYQRWQSSMKARTSFFRTFFAYSFNTEIGPLTPSDLQLFKCFDSFARLEQQRAAARVMEIKPVVSEDIYHKKALRHTQIAAYQSKIPTWQKVLFS